MFLCHLGSFRFLVMPFGINNATACYQRFMMITFADGPFVLSYMDDVLVVSDTWEEHLQRLEKVFTRIRVAGLHLPMKKCCFGRNEVALLGHVVGEDYVKADRKKLDSIVSAPRPKTQKGLPAFLGMSTYYQRFISSLSHTAAPLHALTSKNVRFRRSDEAEGSFQALKDKMSQPPVLMLPDFEKQFLISTDFSGWEIRAVLSEVDDNGCERPISYSSRTLSITERTCSVFKRESSGVVFGQKAFRPYVLGAHCLMRVDHQSRRDAFTKRDIDGGLARWLHFFSE